MGIISIRVKSPGVSNGINIEACQRTVAKGFKSSLTLVGGGMFMAAENNMDWFRESRFGMFIHWGIYSILGRGEWVMYSERIPIKEYEKLSVQFNPVKFNADEWVKLAKSAGMKYIVITAKHHDGFSMFDTAVSDFNIVDATPFKLDIMAELSESCRREGLKLCFYYSHVREWRHPHAQSFECYPKRFGGSYGNYGNFWDYHDEEKKNLQVYIDEFDKPQLQELLTKYGPIGLIWFDTPSLIRPDQAQELVDIVRALQPNCLVNSRAGSFTQYDYESRGDCEIPGINTGMDWETPMTICNGWGYNAQPDNIYRQPKELISQLVEVVSMGGNYLLNVGPDALGVIPAQAQSSLRGLGDWVQSHGESIYGTNASPFPYKPQWGRITQKNNLLYLHIFNWQPEITLTGLCSIVSKVHVLTDQSRTMLFTQSFDEKLGYSKLKIQLAGKAPDAVDSVLVVTVNEQPAVFRDTIQKDDGDILLPAYLASLHVSEGSHAKVAQSGEVENWLSADDWVSWKCVVEDTGLFDLEVTVNTNAGIEWDFGHVVQIEVAGQTVTLEIVDSGQERFPNEERVFRAGTVRIDIVGRQDVVLKPIKVSARNHRGLALMSIGLKKSQCR